MTVTDRLRTETYLSSYDFWLDVYGVRGSRRKELRRELRANLADATGDRGADAALEALGPARLLAAQNAEDQRVPGRPTWHVGALAAVTTFAVTLLGMLLGALHFLDGVRAAGGGPASGELFGYPGIVVEATSTADTLGLGVSGFPWTVVVLTLLAFLLGAKVWRLLMPKAADPS